MVSSSHTRRAVPPGPGPAAGNRRLTVLVIVGLALAGLALLFRTRHEADPLAALQAFPHAYIAVEDAGYDPGKLVFLPGPVPGPERVEHDGRVLWPAHICSDARLVPTRDGRPYLFPVMREGTAMPASSPLPPHGRILSGPDLRHASPYLSPEAQAKLAAFTERMR